MDSIRMLEVMLGIPGVHVTSAGATGGEARIEIETSAGGARCPSCGSQAEVDGRQLTDLGVHSSMGQPVRLVWQRRKWRCEQPGCGGSFVEQDEEIAAFQQRSPHRGGDAL